MKETVNTSVFDSETGETLASKLLSDLARKYQTLLKSKNYSFHANGTGSGGAAIHQQRTQMINDVQTLIAALIKADKRIHRLAKDKKTQVAKLKGIVKD